MSTETKIHQQVREHYGEYARSSSSSCCTPQNTMYPAEVIKDIPADIAGFTAGNGDPVTPAKLQPGETVLDLGSGGGLDCFLAARQVGESGHVIGVDMTPEMNERARQAAERLGMKQVEFREGLLEALPVDAGSVDVIISNCVINLSPDKPQVLREAFRVLKPGGRFSVSDTVANHPIPEEKRKDMEDWCGCVSGALPLEEYRAELAKAGFEDIQIEPNIELVKQTLEASQCCSPQGAAKEQFLKDVANFAQCDKTMFVPHIITARKPG